MQKRLTTLWIVVGIVSVALILAGCATIFKGSSQEVKINSTPSQAKVVVKTTLGMTVWEGSTPASVRLSKKNEYMVTISMDGYKEQTVNIIHDGIEGWFWGNLICGGVIGIVVDLVDGAIHRMGPSDITVTLATAHLQDNSEVKLAVFYALDDDGQLRSMAVPLQKAN